MKVSSLCNLPELGEKTQKKFLQDLQKESAADRYYIYYYSIEGLALHALQNRDWSLLEALYKLEKSGTSLKSLHLKFLLETQGCAAFVKELNQNAQLSTIEVLNMLLSEKDLRLSHGILDFYLENQQNDQALAFLHNLLIMEMGEDIHYQYLLEHFPEQAESVLSNIQSFNTYEERPLIWLAELQRRNGNPKLAHQTIQKAIALDPSDGEQGKETRMEAYHVLSKIYRDEGNIEKATFFLEVLQSIRKGEHADDFLYLGMENKAIELYQDALSHFNDAYCLQSRLAKTLAKSGRWEEAEKHYQKAFELMPVSFGPIESHCFGCEGIFEDEKARGLAKATFTKFIQENPNNPRTYYLFGLLLRSEGQTEEAFQQFMKAFELDPRYYNCAEIIEAFLFEDPELRAKHPKVLSRVIAITPPIFLPDRFSQRIDLKEAWLDAKEAVNHIQYPDLPEYKLPISTNTENQHYEQYSSGPQLLEFLKHINYDYLLRDNELLDIYL